MSSPNSPHATGAEQVDVAVVGGGIGGLSAALALKAAGVGVTVIERMPKMSAVGGALQVWTNGMEALLRLGAAERVKTRGIRVNEWSFRSWRGGELFRVPVGEFARKYGLEPPRVVPRVDVVEALVDALGMENIRMGSVWTGFGEDPHGVTIRLEDGSELRANVLVAADGIESRIRVQLLPGTEPRYVGYQYIRALVDGHALQLPNWEDEVIQFTVGRGDRFGLYPKGNGWAYWFCVVVKQTPAGGHFQGNKNELLEVLRDFPSPVPQIVEATPPETIAGQDIRDLRPLERWTTDRLTLLGDAAHAMTPNLGRGASEAIEDGISLAGFLSRVDRTDRVAVRDALAAFEERRRGATTPIQKRSNRLGWLLSQRFPGYVPMRERVMKQVTARVMPKKVEREFAAMASERDEGRSVASPSAS